MAIDLIENNRKEREISNESYAAKYIEKGVLWTLGFFAMGVLTFLGSLLSKILIK